MNQTSSYHTTMDSGALPERARPEILAPAGDTQAFLAALAAGADAIYLGLKNFSARMQAENFSLKELAALTELARGKGCRVHVAVNTMLKPGDLDAAGRLIDRLEHQVNPAALIVQDLGVVELARQAGFKGELHLSTLANLSHPAAVRYAREVLKVDRVVLPRELSLDEIKAVAAACPPGLSLEIFAHGALCYGVSGRCYWSSYMGGKSSLRGRCVQPCRRMYAKGGASGRFFSCKDLSLDVLCRTLASVPQVRSLKIEGRKKGPHYVFHTVKAYKLLLDNPTDPEAKKTALDLLEQALGRPSTHYTFLPQRPHPAIEPATHTSSGSLAGKVQADPKTRAFIRLRAPLMGGDLLRVGHEDEPWHQIVKVRRAVPKTGRLDFKPTGPSPKTGTPVYLIDRRAPELMELIAGLERELAAMPQPPGTEASDFSPIMPRRLARKDGKAASGRSTVLDIWRRSPRGKAQEQTGVWLDKSPPDMPGAVVARTWWMLPPVVWPDEEEMLQAAVKSAIRRGGRFFILNAPWQMAFFRDADRKKDLVLYAGPFCNIANGLALESLRRQGFQGAVASPELSKEDLLALPGQSPLPLGLVVQGLWPLSLSRILAAEVKTEEPLKSPKGEVCWARRHGGTYWIFPGWEMDIAAESRELAQAGYSLFLRLHEQWPKQVPRRERTSRFNLDLTLL